MVAVSALFQSSVAFEPILEREQFLVWAHFFAVVDVVSLLLTPKSFDSGLL